MFGQLLPEGGEAFEHDDFIELGIAEDAAIFASVHIVEQLFVALGFLFSAK